MEYALGDRQFFEAMVRKLEKRAPLDGSRAPIFTGAYAPGNHVAGRVPDGGKKYGDGQQPALNRIHNLDDAFGKFWDYFVDSPHTRTTIVIFTSDHAPYPEPEFLGGSIHDGNIHLQPRYRGLAVAEFADNVFVIDDEGAHRQGFTDRYPDELASLQRFIRETHDLEAADRTWPRTER